VDEATRLLNASLPDLRTLIQAALQTGCREGELLAARVRDFDPHSKTLLIPDSKSGKPRRVPLTEQGASLCANATAGKAEDAPMFRRGDGSPWYRMAILRAMAEACKAAKVGGGVTFYTLRHTYASLLVQAGTPLLFVATALGHRDARMVEKHYAHLAPSQVADAIRANLPSFGEDASRKVTDIRGRKRAERK
jgi:integrase